MSLRQAVVRVSAVIAAKTFNHEGHEGKRTKAPREDESEFPTSRAKNAREMGHPDFGATENWRCFI
jgi:hypothetical protein